MGSPPALAERSVPPIPTEPESQSRRREASALIVLGIVVALVFIYSMLAATDAHFTPQVVDLYLVCQYAKAMAEGHPFQYNPGDPPTTGATSLLHTMVLAVGHAVGIRGEGLVAFAILVGAVAYVASIVVARRVGTMLAGPREGLLAGALVALGGPVVWGFLYGSDIALFMLLSIWLFERLLASWADGRLRAPIGVAGLLALARPEGLPIGIVLAAGWTKGLRLRGQQAVSVWIPAALGIAVLGFNRSLTGQWLGTSLADKSLVANYGLGQGLALIAEYLTDLARGVLLGFYPSQTPIGFARGWAPFYFPPLALVFVVFAVVVAPPHLRLPLRLWLSTLVLVSILGAANVFMGVHFNRYVMWTFPSLQAVSAAGLGLLTRRVAGGDNGLEGSLFWTAAIMAVALGLLSTIRFAVQYGDMAGEVYARDVAAARWIIRNLPPGTSIANLATGVEYLTGHRAVNLHGVTTPAFFGNTTAEREAGTLESLGRLAPAERPSYLISSVVTQEKGAGYRELVEEPPLFATAVGADELLIFRMRYDLVGKNHRMLEARSLEAVRALDEVDRLNVCDSRDEKSHDYEYRSEVRSQRLHGTVRVGTYSGEGGTGERLMDAGRAILGHEAFRIHTRPGRELVMVVRTASDVGATVLAAEGSGRRELSFPEAGMIVQVDGVQVVRTTFRPGPGWDEQVFHIPAATLTREQTHLRITGQYASFYYWFFQ
jgi:hypothetical protein